jgi:YfdX protein
MFTVARQMLQHKRRRKYMANRNLRAMAWMATGLCLMIGAGCSRSEQGRSSVEASSVAPSNNAPAGTKTDGQKAEPKSPETQSVEPQVQSEIEKMEAQKRASLLQDAQSAIMETRAALAALDNGDKQTALSALAQATGKLDLVISRDPKLAFAPIDVNTTIFDLYATPDTVKRVVKDARDDLSNSQVQQARLLVTPLASEADTHVAQIPLATYPAAIKAVAPLIDAGKTEEAKAALEAALTTLVIETYVIPLPRVRAQALLQQAEQVAANASRTQDDNQRVHSLIEATRTQIQLAEALGYGTKDDYKPLFAQLDDVQKEVEGGKSGKGLFERFEQSLKRFKFSS